MTDQNNLITIRKPSGAITSCEPKHLQIYLNKGFTVVEGLSDDNDDVSDNEEDLGENDGDD